MNAPHDQLATGRRCSAWAGRATWPCSAPTGGNGSGSGAAWYRCGARQPVTEGSAGPGRRGGVRRGILRRVNGQAGHRREGGRGIKGLGPDTRALAAAGRRVGFASIVLALCVPLILPGLHPSKLFSSGPGIGGTGGGGGRHAGAAGCPVPGRRPAAREPPGHDVHVPDQRLRVRAGQRRGVLQAVRVRHPGAVRAGRWTTMRPARGRSARSRRRRG